MHVPALQRAILVVSLARCTCCGVTASSNVTCTGCAPAIPEPHRALAAKYAGLPVQYASSLCVKIPQDTLWENISSISPAMRRGCIDVCAYNEACWLLPTDDDVAYRKEDQSMPHPVPPPPDLTALERDVTIFVSSGARPSDSMDGHHSAHQVLLRTISSMRTVFGLQRAHVVVTLDGCRCKPGLTHEIAHHYVRKIKLLHARLRGTHSTLVVHDMWLHKVEALRRSFQVVPRSTPLVFVIEDDSSVRGPVAVDLIHHQLLHDPTVHMVKFHMYQDCIMAGKMDSAMRPCERHPETPLIHSIRLYNDRPHFARWDFYLHRVFSAVAVNTRTTMEQICTAVSDKEGDWNMWVYGLRGEMYHDEHLAFGKDLSSYTATTGSHIHKVHPGGPTPRNVATQFAHV